MDGARQNLYFSDMVAPPKATHRVASASPVPAFFLYGEAPQAPDEATVHVETIAARSRLHDWTIRPHRHRDLYQILLVQKGAVTARLDRETCALRGPCVVIAPPGAVHGFEFEADTVGWVCSFSIGLAQDLSARSAGFRRFLEQPAAAALSTATVLATDLVELSEMLLREFERSALGRETALRGLRRLLFRIRRPRLFLAVLQPPDRIVAESVPRSIMPPSQAQTLLQRHVIFDQVGIA